jgi:hypothetical protein
MLPFCETYPNLFIVSCDAGNFSFRYCEILPGWMLSIQHAMSRDILGDPGLKYLKFSNCLTLEMILNSSFIDVS